MRLFILFFIIAFHPLVAAENLNGIHINTYGNSNNQALLYVHGGPDYNSHDFEVTTATNLSRLGYFVVTFDQRGQGRSSKTDPTHYNYSQYADDIKMIIESYKLKDVVLLGHSHGGIISIHTLKKYPELIKKVALLGAPIDWISMTDAIVENCKESYSSVGNSEYLEGLEKIEASFKNYESLNDVQKIGTISWIFIHARACGLYNVANPTAEHMAFEELLKKNPIEAMVAENAQKPMPGFVKNEDYVRTNLLEFVARNNSKFCGLYGAEDGLFTAASLDEIHKAIDPTKSGVKFHIIKGASHHFYFQKQKEFFEQLQSKCDLH